MTLQGDLRSVVHPRSGVNAIVQRLTAAANGAVPVTLSVRDASTLLTFIEAATRVAEGVAQQRLAVNASRAEISSLQYQLRKMTEAWEASERALWQRDLELAADVRALWAPAAETV